MISYLIQHPKVASAFGAIGIILCLIGLAQATVIIVPKAMAYDCVAAGAPAIPQNQGYALQWRVVDWLTFNRIPIGPAAWTVGGRIREGSAQNCFLENWRIRKMVFQSSRHSTRGQIIDTGDLAAMNQHSLGFWGAAPLNQPFDNAYRQLTGGAAQDWSPMGLYGLLKSDKDGLNDSRGYLPVEWQVTGRF